MRGLVLCAHLNAPPSYLRALVNTTVFAGMFKPVEKVSVANSTCTGTQTVHLLHQSILRHSIKAWHGLARRHTHKHSATMVII